MATPDSTTKPCLVDEISAELHGAYSLALHDAIRRLERSVDELYPDIDDRLVDPSLDWMQ